MPDRLTDEQLLQLQGGLLAIGGMFGGEVGEALHKLTEAAHGDLPVRYWPCKTSMKC
jgi:hypothetical protein